MDETKKQRLAKLKLEMAELKGGTKKPELDIWGDPIVKRKKSRKDEPLFPDIPTQPSSARIEPTVRPRIETQPPQAATPSVPLTKVAEPQESKITVMPPKERIKIYGWPDGYALANGRLVNPDSPEYADAEKYKIFHPPNQWIAKTLDGTEREFEISVELDTWDNAQLKRVNKVTEHSKAPRLQDAWNPR